MNSRRKTRKRKYRRKRPRIKKYKKKKYRRKKRATKKIKITPSRSPRHPFYKVQRADYIPQFYEKDNETIIPDTTPFQNKQLRREIQTSVTTFLRDPYSFSPAVNKVLEDLKSISPNPKVFTCHQHQKVNIVKHGRKKCVHWRTKLARTTMLDNLRSKTNIRCNNIIAPKQSLSNCWFNAFFMIFFISDKGRKFHRFLRETMITSVLPTGKKIHSSLQWPFFLLNKYIEASLRGQRDPSRFAKLMDTNNIIRRIYHSIHKGYPDIAKTRVPANPLNYYLAIMEYLGKGEAEFALSWINIHNLSYYGIIKQIKYKIHQDNIPDILFVEYSDIATFKKKREIHVSQYKYVLDSAVLRDTKQQHFSAYITCNGRDYGFDGESFSRLAPFPWKKNMNKDMQWRFAEQYNTYFNFMKGYQLLVYYRK